MTARGVRRALASAAVVLAAAGCGTAGGLSPPMGVDGLQIPTASPNPADFVDVVDNPWFPITTTESQRQDISGVLTTSVTEGLLTDYYAQDTEGNVWWFGREGEWIAGVDGAEAGLWVPANPRVGDGWRTAYAPGVLEETAEVASVEGEIDGRTGLLVIERRSEPRREDAVITFYERGAGVVSSQTVIDDP